jgi:phage terminase large subunit-like protein
MPRAPTKARKPAASAGACTCPVEAYARAVVSGDVVAGRLVKLACERHLRDLQAGPARGLRWDGQAAQHAIAFFGFLQHSKGEWAGRPLTLSPWQQFIVGSLFGWKTSEGIRRFRMAYCELARKNGKSTMAAGIGLYLAFFSGEAGAEVYTAATKRDQARIVHSEAVRMVKKSAGLRRLIKVFKDNLSAEATNSKYEPLGKDADTLDGLNPSGVIVDELHAHKTRDMLDVLETATGARREPLIFVITTAGVAGGQTVCQEMHDYGEKVLDGTLEDDTLFAFIAAIDQGDDWKDEACWPKANPNLGVSCKLEDLRAKCTKAKEMPSAQATFRQKHLDEWVQAIEVWLPDDRWMQSANARPVGPGELLGRECYGGLDLANTLDLCALVLVFPRGETTPFVLPDAAAQQPHPPASPATSAAAPPPALVLAESYDVLAFFWTPEDCAKERERTNRTNYRTWISQGLITATDGDVTDYDVIRRDLVELGRRYRIMGLAYDPHNATQLANQLTQDGFTVEQFLQRITSYNEPMMALEKLAKEGRFRHGGNPVLRWMIGNVHAIRNGLGQQMPSRKKSKDKIDGAVAALMALSMAMKRPDSRDWYSPGCLRN